jgi:outer membrane protein insertion porin family
MNHLRRIRYGQLQEWTALQTLAASYENFAMRGTASSRSFRVALAPFLFFVVGCQMTPNTTNMPTGISTPHNSMFKPAPQDPPADSKATTNGMRIRGQSPASPYRTNGATVGSSRPPMQPTDLARPNSTYGSATIPRSGTNFTPASQYSGQSTLDPLAANAQYGSSNPTLNAPNKSGTTNTPRINSIPSALATGPNSNALPSGGGQLVQYTQPQTGFAPQTYAQPPQPFQQPSQYQQFQDQTYQQPTQTQTQSPGQAVDPQPFQPGYQQPGYQQPGVNPYAVGPGTSNGQSNTYQQPNAYQPNGYGAPLGEYGSAIAPGVTGGPGTFDSTIAPGVYGGGSEPNLDPSLEYQRPERVTPLIVNLQEARTGRVMLGGSVNSDLGLSGQLTIDERNFDIRRFPRSWDDVWSGKAFRGEGQAFRAELMPGTLVQRYTVNWTQRNLFGYLPYSLSVGGFLFTRQYRDWTEQRLGGRTALGYEITKDLSISTELRMEDVKIFDPRVNNVDSLNRVLGSNDVYTGRVRLAHDTRDSPFMSTQGHLLELIYDQVFGEFDYPRAMVNYNRYFLVTQRPDESGRHTLASSWKFGFSGADTPLFENFFAGGYSTMRGFRFRGASPVDNDVQVGGRFMFLGSLEYVFPLTADEMLRGVAFVDYGTIEQDISLKSKNFRVAPGLGLRIAIPALGPAPLAFDFAVPVNKADTDQTQIFSFFMGFTR